MNPQEQIEQRAKSYAKDKWSFEYDDLHKRLRVTTSKTDFKAGADYVLSRPELMKEHITGFFDWYQKEGYKVDKDAMMGMPTDELFSLYLEHLKQKT